MPINKEIAREKLILAGERLVARHGLDGLSLRKVNIEAGQKNTSAALYHFGDREGLLIAIFDYRLANTNARRHELLDADSSSLRALIRAWVLPDVEEITGTPGGSYHARFLANVTNHPEFDMRVLWGRPHASSFARLGKLLRQQLPDIPESLFSMRFGMAMLQSIYATADQESLQGNTHSTALFVSHLIDVMKAILVAPVSDETAHEIALQDTSPKKSSPKSG